MEENQKYLVLYNTTTMMSEVETNTAIVFWVDYVAIEIVCYIAGISNETLYMYIDYKQLLSFIPRLSKAQENDPVKRGVDRKEAVVSFLLSNLYLDKAGSNEKNIWKLSLRHVPPPQQQCGKKSKHYVREITNASSSDSADEKVGTENFLEQIVIQKPSTLNPLDLERYAASYNNMVDQRRPISIPGLRAVLCRSNYYPPGEPITLRRMSSLTSLPSSCDLPTVDEMYADELEHCEDDSLPHEKPSHEISPACTSKKQQVNGSNTSFRGGVGVGVGVASPEIQNRKGASWSKKNNLSPASSPKCSPGSGKSGKFHIFDLIFQGENTNAATPPYANSSSCSSNSSKSCAALQTLPRLNKPCVQPLQLILGSSPSRPQSAAMNGISGSPPSCIRKQPTGEMKTRPTTASATTTTSSSSPSRSVRFVPETSERHASSQSTTTAASLMLPQGSPGSTRQRPYTASGCRGSASPAVMRTFGQSINHLMVTGVSNGTTNHNPFQRKGSMQWIENEKQLESKTKTMTNPSNSYHSPLNPPPPLSSPSPSSRTSPSLFQLPSSDSSSPPGLLLNPGKSITTNQELSCGRVSSGSSQRVTNLPIVTSSAAGALSPGAMNYHPNNNFGMTRTTTKLVSIATA